MKAFSRDMRIRALDALDLGTPRKEVVRLFGVSTATLTRWRRRQRETGSLAESPRPGPGRRKTVGLAAALVTRLAEHADALLEEHCQWWEETSGHRVSHATMSRAIAGVGWTRKKDPSRERTRRGAARGLAHADAGRGPVAVRLGGRDRQRPWDDPAVQSGAARAAGVR